MNELRLWQVEEAVYTRYLVQARDRTDATAAIKNKSGAYITLAHEDSREAKRVSLLEMEVLAGKEG